MTYQVGDVYVRLEDGAVALNVQGMEAGLFARYLGLLAEDFGEEATVRNATQDERREILGPGVWFVCQGKGAPE